MTSESPRASRTVWDLNPIVLAHTNRFFQAATLVVRTWSDKDQALLGALMKLSGNMLWAGSSFATDDREKEKGMAHSGALIGALADYAMPDGGGIEAATRALAVIERQVREHHDAILDLVARDLAEAEVEVTPAALNARVWKRLFPEFPYELSVPELGASIRAWLVEAAPA